MKSWRFTGTNEPLQLAELPEPTAGPGQVVVDVKAAGICTPMWAFSPIRAG